MNALQIFATGANITTGLTSASAAIPVTSSGALPSYVRLCATVACYAKVGPSTVAAAAGDILINPETPVILYVRGVTHIAAIQAAAAGVLNIAPIENT